MPAWPEAFRRFLVLLSKQLDVKGCSPRAHRTSVEVDRRVPPDLFPGKSVVSWYKSKGTLALDLPGLPNAV